MSDKVITQANVIASTAATKNSGTAGATITAGQAIYKNTATNTYFPAINSAGTVQVVAGIALNNAFAGQPITFTASDPAFTPGFSTSIGETLYLSGTAGNICPVGDLITGSQPVILYLGTGTATAVLNITAAGVQK